MRTRRTLLRTLMVVMAGFLPVSILASAWAISPGELDPNFSGDGYVLLPEQQVAVEALGSGKALAVSSDWTVRRFTVSGPRDLAYGGGDGITRPEFEADAQRASDAALQPDGKLVIVGTVIEGLATKTAVARLTAAGALDTTFSGDGIRTIAAGAYSGFIGSAVAVAATGRIVIAGSTGVEPGTGAVADQDVAVIALTPGGARIGSFGGSDGIATVDVAGDRDMGEGVAVQPDGRVVVVTTSTRSDGKSVMGVVRLTEEGALDASLSQDGRVVITFRNDVESWGGSTGSDVEVNATTGEISVGGSVTNGTDEDTGPYFAVARLDRSGTVLRRWTTLTVGDFAVVNAIDLIGRDVVAVGWVRDSVADCCGWLIARFGSVEYANKVFLPDTYNSGTFDVSVVGAKAYVVGSVEAAVNGQSRRGAIARFFA